MLSKGTYQTPKSRKKQHIKNNNDKRLASSMLKVGYGWIWSQLLLWRWNIAHTLPHETMLQVFELGLHSTVSNDPESSYLSLVLS